MKAIKGRVIKAIASKFFVDIEDDVKICYARKKLKLDGDIFVGDWVFIEKEQKTYVIEEVIKRKNILLRPYISNVDICLIVIACEPEPDFLLVDKIIVNCLKEDIVPVLIVNKADVGVVEYKAYENVLPLFVCSAVNPQTLSELINYIKGKTVCFAGQSAVGKSSILNAILDKKAMEVGELSSKIKRGKNTTRHSEVFKVQDGTYLIDTCGFSMLDTIDIPSEELRFYFDDLEKFRKECKFNSCTHIDEPNCAVKEHVGLDIDKGRYERYKIIYNELEDRRKSKYD